MGDAVVADGAGEDGDGAEGEGFREGAGGADADEAADAEGEELFEKAGDDGGVDAEVAADAGSAVRVGEDALVAGGLVAEGDAPGGGEARQADSVAVSLTGRGGWGKEET